MIIFKFGVYVCLNDCELKKILNLYDNELSELFIIVCVFSYLKQFLYISNE